MCMYIVKITERISKDEIKFNKKFIFKFDYNLKFNITTSFIWLSLILKN